MPGAAPERRISPNMGTADPGSLNKRKIEKMNAELNKALNLLQRAAIDGRHQDGCPRGDWIISHRYLPAMHPDRKRMPVCTCWIGEAFSLLNRHNMETRQNG